MNSPVNKQNALPITLSTIDGVVTESLALSDRATHYGHGLFETMLYSAGTVPLWQRHSSRIVTDALVLGVRLSKHSLEDNLSAFLSLLKQQSPQASGIIKIIVTAGSGGRGYASPAAVNPRIICQYSSLPANLEQSRRKGIALTQCQYQLPLNPVLAGIKHLNRLDQVLARAEWGSEFADGIMYSHDNLLIETTCANIFIKTTDGWITPKIDQAGVRGVMRALLLEQLFPQCGIAVTEGAIIRQQLAASTEIFICSSIRGLFPITHINNLGQWAIGTETKMLQSTLIDLYDCYPC